MQLRFNNITMALTDDQIADIGENIIKNLKTVYDPEIPVDIFELGLIYDVFVSENNDVKILMTLTSPNCPVAETLPVEVEEKVKTINGLVHPAVRADFETWAYAQKSPYVLKEAALLFETGSYKDLDKVINVSSPIRIRISRVLMRDPHRNEKQVNDIIDKQLPDEEKNKLADFVIKNTDNKLLIPQVLEIHKQLMKV